MDFTKEKKMSANLENAYNLLKEFKNELTKQENNITLNEKTNNLINQVSDIIEEAIKNSTSNQNNTVNKDEKKVLLISSKTKKVVLPYSKEQVSRFLKTNKYQSEKEVIENEFTIPLSKYHNEALSRVIESYKLARKKQNMGIVESLKYAVNLIFERRLHPAVITACNTIDELDIYLACLDENATELFDFFDVVFDYSPLEVNNN